MTGTIINPIWFYLIDVLGTVEIVSIVVAFLSVAIILAFSIVYIDAAADRRELSSLGRKLVKCIVSALVISLLMILIIPSKETMVEMMVAKYATYENASSAVDAVKNAADYIVDAVLKIKKG